MFSQRNRELHAAIYVGDLAGVIKCLDRGPKRERAKADQADCYGCLPLIKAAGNDYKYYTDYTACRICSALLDRGAAVDQRWNNWDKTALYVACRGNRFQTAELLLAHGANVNFTEDDKHYTPLHIACFQGNVDMVRLLLDHGADVKRRSKKRLEPPYIACRRGHVEVVTLMFDRDPQYWSFGFDGPKALAAACSEENMDMVRCLLARGVVVHKSLRGVAHASPAIKALLDAAAPPEKRRLAHWVNRFHLHVVGPRGDHRGSTRHQLLNCRHLARHLVSFLCNDFNIPSRVAYWNAVSGFPGMAAHRRQIRRDAPTVRW